MKSTSNAGRLRSGDDNGKAMRGGLHSSRDLKHKKIIHLRNLDTPRCSLSGTCKRDSEGQPGQDTPMPCDSPVLIDACVHVLQTPAMRRRSGVQSDCACNRDDPRADAATGMGAPSACLAMAAGQLQCSHALQHRSYIGAKMQTQAVAPAPSRRIRALTCLPADSLGYLPRCGMCPATLAHRRAPAARNGLASKREPPSTQLPGTTRAAPRVQRWKHASAPGPLSQARIDGVHPQRHHRGKQAAKRGAVDRPAGYRHTTLHAQTARLASAEERSICPPGHGV